MISHHSHCKRLEAWFLSKSSEPCITNRAKLAWTCEPSCADHSGAGSFKGLTSGQQRFSTRRTSIIEHKFGCVMPEATTASLGNDSSSGMSPKSCKICHTQCDVHQSEEASPLIHDFLLLFRCTIPADSESSPCPPKMQRTDLHSYFWIGTQTCTTPGTRVHLSEAPLSNAFAQA